MCLRRFDDNSYTRMQFLRAVSHRIGAVSSNLCDGPTDSDSDASSDEEQHDADASTNAVVETVATPGSDMNDCNVYLVALSRLWHVATSIFVRPARTTWNVREVDVPSAAQTSKWSCVSSDVQLRYVNNFTDKLTWMNLALPILCL